MNFRSDSRGGYIALMSAIVLSVMLMGILVSLNLSGFFGRFNVLNSKLKENSFALAMGCVDAAVLKLAADPAYTGGETLAIGSETCDVFVVDPVAGTIEAQGVYRDAYTNLVATVDLSSMSIASLEEVPTLP